MTSSRKCASSGPLAVATVLMTVGGRGGVDDDRWWLRQWPGIQ